jgi:hypothetical protein
MRAKMKRLLVVLSILGMVSAANATLQISVNGEQEPVDTEIIIFGSETLTLDIWTDADIPQFGGGSWMLICDTTMGSIDPGISLVAGYSYGDPPYTADKAEVIPPEGLEGIWGFYADFAGTSAGTTLYDEIIFHCEYGDPPGDVTIYLMDAPDGQPASTIFDTVVIHHIVPEPMTAVLLGLGGLLVLRRRK